MKLQLVGPAYDTSIIDLSQQKCINWYPDWEDHNAVETKFNMILRPTPGIVEGVDFDDFDSGRASIVYRDIGYAVLDNTFVKVEDTGVPSYIDVLSTSTGYVAMAGGSNGIIMADGTYAYFYDLSTHTFSRITDGDLPANPIGCAYYDGYYILIFQNSEKFYYSLDPTAWDALDFNSVITTADYLTAVYADHQELWFFGTGSVEVFYNSGDQDAPLQRRPGIFIPKGCRAANTIVPMDNSFYWLGNDAGGGYRVYRSNGYNAELVPAQGGIATQIDSYDTVSDAYAFCHNIGTHQFYVLTFPTENVTWAFDLVTGLWHQRASIVTTDPFSADYEPYLKAHRAKNHFFTNNTHYVLDQYSGAISYYDNDTFTEFSQPIMRQRRTSQLSADKKQTGNLHEYNNQLHTYRNFVINMLTGVALSSGQGSDPEVMLSVSTDGGHTWEDAGNRNIGAQGVYNQQIKWDILGQARAMVFDIRVTDPVRAVLLGGTVEVEKDTN